MTAFDYRKSITKSLDKANEQVVAWLKWLQSDSSEENEWIATRMAHLVGSKRYSKAIHPNMSDEAFKQYAREDIQDFKHQIADFKRAMHIPSYASLSCECHMVGDIEMSVRNAEETLRNYDLDIAKFPEQREELKYIENRLFSSSFKLKVPETYQGWRYSDKFFTERALDELHRMVTMLNQRDHATLTKKQDYKDIKAHIDRLRKSLMRNYN